MGGTTMTLEQAQEQFGDALQLTLTHKPYAMHEYRLRKIGEQGLLYKEGKTIDKPYKVLYIELGKTKSRVIFSREAYIKDLINEDPLIANILNYLKYNKLCEIWVANIIRKFEIGFRRAERLLNILVQIEYLTETDNPQKFIVIIKNKL